MKKITNLINKFSVKRLFLSFLMSLFVLVPMKVSAELAETEINGGMINASSEFLRDLDYETWQLVVYKSPINNKVLPINLFIEFVVFFIFRVHKSVKSYG